MPVLGGVLLLGAIFGFLWLMAAWLSGDDTETSERLAPTRLELGSVTARADDVAEEGPLLFQELDTVTGTRSIQSEMLPQKRVRRLNLLPSSDGG